MKDKTTSLAYAALLCALLIVSTLWFKFTIPGTDVLFTTQVFFVLLCGQILTPRYCLYCIGTYLLLGLIGLPVFSAVVGIGVVVTPSFGYLVAFPFAAAFASWMRSKTTNALWGRVVSSLASLVVIYVIALMYIAALKGLYLDAPVPVSVLITSYCLAFLPADLVKAVLAGLFGGRLSKILSYHK